jgi:hypothetical protein
MSAAGFILSGPVPPWSRALFHLLATSSIRTGPKVPRETCPTFNSGRDNGRGSRHLQGLRCSR